MINSFAYFTFNLYLSLACTFDWVAPFTTYTDAAIQNCTTYANATVQTYNLDEVIKMLGSISDSVSEKKISIDYLSTVLS